MELRQLEYFVAVVEEASFTRAAARVHVAQPGVSAQVRQLERELGEPLLDRSGKTVRPTAPHWRAAWDRGPVSRPLVGRAGPPPAAIGTEVGADEPLVAGVAQDNP